MKIIPLQKNPMQYTCNSYLILGDWNKLDDLNTLIDVGMDDYIVDEIEKINTGVGKKVIDQIIITHDHFDHSAGLKHLIKRYKPLVYAYLKITPSTQVLKPGDMLRAGDGYLEVLHTSQHSSDSVCLYSKQDGVLFSGDTPVHITSKDSTCGEAYIDFIKLLYHMKIRVIYPGHGAPITQEIHQMLKITLECINGFPEKDTKEVEK